MQVLIAVMLVFALSGCARGGQPDGPASVSHSLPSSGLLASVEWSGGFCANLAVCRSGLTVNADGTWLRLSGGKTRSGRLQTTDLETVRAAVQTTAMDSAPPFTGQCPTVYDGSEATFGFVRDGSTSSVKSCTKEIPSTDPLATVLGRLFDQTG